MDWNVLYSQWNMAGFSWDGQFARSKSGKWHVTEYTSDSEECGCMPVECYTFTPQEMFMYAVCRESDTWGWADEITQEIWPFS